MLFEPLHCHRCGYDVETPRLPRSIARLATALFYIERGKTRLKTG